MKIACVTYFLPGKENNQGPNSLLYQIISKRSKDLKVDLFIPESILRPIAPEKISIIENELDVNIIKIPQKKENFFHKCLTFWWPTGARVNYERYFLKEDDYDLVWGYPFWTAPHIKKINSPRIISGMDSVSLLYFRKFKTCIKERAFATPRYFFALLRAFIFELFFLRNERVHVVGKMDHRVLESIGVRSFYVAHPINPINLPEKEKEKGKEKSERIVRILISNALHGFYGSRRVLDWLSIIFSTVGCIENTSFEIIFHKGRKDLIEDECEKFFKPDNISLNFINWVDNYEALLSKVDIQIFPLDIGAGTKTSVLTALRMNVVCIGTEVACENIDVLDFDNFLLEANSSKDFHRALEKALSFIQNRMMDKYSHVLSEIHDPEKSVAVFWREATHEKK